MLEQQVHIRIIVNKVSDFAKSDSNQTFIGELFRNSDSHQITEFSDHLGFLAACISDLILIGLH